MTITQVGAPPVLPTAESRRRKSVEIAIADSRIDGFPPPDDWELEILAAYIRGEIEPDNLVEVMKKALLQR